MKTTALLLIAILLAVTACEKEPIELSTTYVDLIGVWDQYHDVAGVSTKDFIINDHVYNYRIQIFDQYTGHFQVIRDGYISWKYPFYIDIQDDSLHFNYERGSSPTPMLPEQGWNSYQQWDNVFMIEYQQWLKF